MLNTTYVEKWVVHNETTLVLPRAMGKTTTKLPGKVVTPPPSKPLMARLNTLTLAMSLIKGD